MNSQQNSSIQQQQAGGGSLLFQPHRTVGLLCTSAPFSFSPGSNSFDSFITVPQQERFVIYKCDTLRPVLVSDALPSSIPWADKTKDTYSMYNGGYSLQQQRDGRPITPSSQKKITQQEFMYHAITDTSLSITVAAHGNNALAQATHATLYKRIKVVHSLPIVRQDNKNKKTSSRQRWGITQVISLGRSKLMESRKDKVVTSFNSISEEDAESEQIEDSNQNNENGLILAFLCARSSSKMIETRHPSDSHDVHVVGESSEDEISTSDDDDSEDSPGDESSLIQTRDEDDTDCIGEIVIVIACRSKLWIEKRIPLTSLPRFYPTCAIHPMTYLNKILIGDRDGSLILLNIRSGKIVHIFKCIHPLTRNDKDEDHKELFPHCITTLSQSPAVDTVAVGTREGNVHLVNLRQDVKLFTLTHNKKDKRKRGGNRYEHEVTSVSFRNDGSTVEYEIAPMAVGLKNGTITIWDLSPKTLKDDSIDHTAKMNAQSITRSILCQMENVHKGGVSKLLFFPQEPLLISTGTISNSILMHVFDNPNHSGRILRHRQGHCSPPVKIRYIHPSAGGILASMADGTDASACQILSCGGMGDCTVRSFSTARSVLDREFSQGKGLVKKARLLGLEDKVDLLLSPVIDFSTCQTRSRDWGDLVTIHQNHSFAYVWSTKRHAQSGPVLRQDEWEISDMKKQPPSETHATSVAMSTCGNFALVGTKGGIIYKYNVQSGLPRGSYPLTRKPKDYSNRFSVAGDIDRTMKIIEREMKLAPKELRGNMHKKIANQDQNRKSKTHDGHSVSGLVIDSLNKTLISVGTDSKLIVWSFQNHAPQSQILLPSQPTKLCQLRDSDLIAIALQNFSLIIFDYSSLTIVRRFGNELSLARHYGPITDLAFGPDGRKLYSSSLDGTIRVWDVPTSSCVDWMAFKSAPIALALSSTGEFLATVHSGRLGICLWCDRSFFQMIHSNGSSTIMKPFLMDDPAIVAETDTVDLENLSKSYIEGSIKYYVASASQYNADCDRDLDDHPIPKHPGLITLSRLPAAHWKNLFHLELVKERNKPTDPPKKPPSAPFFLQWRSGESIVETRDVKKIRENKDPKVSGHADDEEWPAVWCEEADDKNLTADNFKKVDDTLDENIDEVKKRKHGSDDHLPDYPGSAKKSKIIYHRSQLAELLELCSKNFVMEGEPRFASVTSHIATLGPSAIDISLSTLCYGMHDLEQGIVLLNFATLWFLESMSLRQNYECINAYLHRFLHAHATTIAHLGSLALGNPEIHGLRMKLLQTLNELKLVQKRGSEELRSKLQRSICLLRHFSRTV